MEASELHGQFCSGSDGPQVAGNPWYRKQSILHSSLRHGNNPPAIGADDDSVGAIIEQLMAVFFGIHTECRLSSIPMYPDNSSEEVFKVDG